MILQALHEHYQRLVEDPETGIAPPGYSPAKVSHALVIGINGQIIDVLNLGTVQGKKYSPRILLVPEQVKRTSGVSANILCDSPAYVMGIELSKQGEPVLAQAKYADFKKKNQLFLEDVSGMEAKAVHDFLQAWNPEKAIGDADIMSKLKEAIGGSNIVFKIDGVSSYIHEAEPICTKWDHRNEDEEGGIVGQCLITGEVAPIARLHPMVKGVIGAQTSGAAVVSFNADSFTSYRKEQSFNSPVSEQAAFAYGTALNYLIANEANRVRLADTTMVFWADKKGGKKEEAILAWSLNPFEAEEGGENDMRRVDPMTARQAKTILERAKKGLTVGDDTLDEGTRCYLLGLAPNAARLSVRFWQVSNFGDIIRRIAQHYADMDISGMARVGGLVSPWRMLKALAVQEESKNIPPLLEGQFLKSILSGQMYPQAIYNLALLRCRSGGDHGGATTIRAAVIKAFLIRKYRITKQPDKEAIITMGLNEENKSTGYLLGRLFSILEKAQKDALGNNINATIRDRYFGAASATPGAVFPLLLRLSRHHISKAEYGSRSDRKIQEVINQLSAFPSHLNMEEQGMFILGYYHQNQANYAKNEQIAETAKG